VLSEHSGTAHLGLRELAALAVVRVIARDTGELLSGWNPSAWHLGLAPHLRALHGAAAASNRLRAGEIEHSLESIAALAVVRQARHASHACARACLCFSLSFGLWFSLSLGFSLASASALALFARAHACRDVRNRIGWPLVDIAQQIVSIGRAHAMGGLMHVSFNTVDIAENLHSDFRGVDVDWLSRESPISNVMVALTLGGDAPDLRGAGFGPADVFKAAALYGPGAPRAVLGAGPLAGITKAVLRRSLFQQVSVGTGVYGARLTSKR
jgi:hypothetical protein